MYFSQDSCFQRSHHAAPLNLSASLNLSQKSTIFPLPFSCLFLTDTGQMPSMISLTLWAFSFVLRSVSAISTTKLLATSSFWMCWLSWTLSQRHGFLPSLRVLFLAAAEIHDLCALSCFSQILLKLPSNFLPSLALNPFINKTKIPRWNPSFPNDRQSLSLKTQTDAVQW